MRSTLLLVILLACPLGAVERLPESEINTGDLMNDVFFEDTADDNDMTMGWVMDGLLFYHCLMRDGEVVEADRQEVLDLLEGKVVVMMVHGRITAFGSISYASKADIQRRASLTVTTPDDEEGVVLRAAEAVPADFEATSQMLKPIFAQLLGQLGQNIELILFDNVGPDGEAVFDPYAPGRVTVGIEAEGRFPEFEQGFTMMCDALFEPRYCANGAKAHVSWIYDPWTGDKLE